MDEMVMGFSVRHCGIKSHIKSFGVIAQRPASAKRKHYLLYKLCFTCAVITLAGNCALSKATLSSLIFTSKTYLLEIKFQLQRFPVFCNIKSDEGLGFFSSCSFKLFYPFILFFLSVIWEMFVSLRLNGQLNKYFWFFPIVSVKSGLTSENL